MPVRAALTALALLAAAAAGTGCGADDGGTITKSDDPRSGARSGFDTTTSPPTSEAIGGTTAAPEASLPPPAVDVPADPPGALLAAVAAFGTALGNPSIRTLQFMIQFPGSTASYGELQSQDPADPTHVDRRSWRDGVVGAPEPVVLAGIGELEANLFSLDEIDWNAIAPVLATAPSAVEGKVGPLENSRGITHLIAERNLPFSNEVVVRVYVDGGDRHPGGYVQFLADATLAKVQA